MTLYNLVTNPSFETSTQGWETTTGATITQTGLTAWSGRYSALVTTDGLQNTEGVLSPPALFMAAAPASVQLRLAGPSGTLQVTVAKNPGGIILGQQTVTLVNDWTNVQFTGLAASTNDSLYIIIATQGAQAISFYLDAVMIEPAATLDPYFDGDSPSAAWTGQPGLSASDLPQPGALALFGGMSMAGQLAIISQGAVTVITPASGQATLTGTIAAISGVDPVAALDDFASWETGTDYDPAMTYVTWNTAGLNSGHTAYTRPWSIFYPPLDYPVSNGTNLWNRAAFAAVGMQYASVGAGAAQNLTCVQLEMMPLAGTTSLDQTPAPTTYDPSRTLHTIVKPTRLNFAQNPAFQGNGWWTGTGNGAFTYDTSVRYPLGGAYDGQVLTTYTQAGKVSISITSGGCSQQLAGLFTGDTYIASIYVLPGNGILDFQLTAGNQASPSIANASGADLTPGTWLQIYVIFTAPAPTATLAINAIADPDWFPNRAIFWCGPCLVESGDILGSYFDGSFSDPDYMWESGGTPGMARSYYYQDFTIQQSVVLDILSRHTPLGLTWAPPLYAQLPTQ